MIKLALCLSILFCSIFVYAESIQLPNGVTYEVRQLDQKKQIQYCWYDTCVDGDIIKTQEYSVYKPNSDTINWVESQN